MHQNLRMAAIALGLIVGTTQAPAVAAPPRATARLQCFSIRALENWKASDAKTFYVRVDLSKYFRIDLANSCQALLWPDSHLITTWRGSGWVCSALDWDLKVSEGAAHDFATPCIVKAMTALTAEEAAAIPSKFKP